MEYDAEGEEVTPPSGQFHPEWQNLLHLRGWNRMQVPFQSVPGTQEAPGLAFQGAERTGLRLGPDGQVLYVLDGLDVGELGTVAAVQRTNDTGSTIPAGCPVRLTSGDRMVPAQADSYAHRAHGVTSAAVATGTAGEVVLYGHPVVRPDWTPIASTADLVADSYYYLAQSVAGHLATSGPTGQGDLVQRIGLATDARTLWVIPELIAIA